MLIIASGAFLAYQFFGGRPPSTGQKKISAGPVTLQFWGVFDQTTAFQPIINAYQAQHPNVKINYTRKELSLYEFVSLNLLASQEGPDVWLIPSEWLPKHADKLSTVPEGFLAAQNLPVQKTALFQKKPAVPTNAALFPKLFAPATADNNLLNGKVLALPLSLDTLGLFANSSLLQAAKINQLPGTWDEVVADTKLLAKHSGIALSQPAINLGTSNNISHPTDILSTLLLQNHTPMVSDDKTPTKIEALFNQTITKATGEPIQPGSGALDFYTSFASPTKENYSWSADQGNDYTLFTAGQLPLFIDYSYRVQDIKQQAPNLALATAPLPQVSRTDQPVSLATAQMVGVPIVSRHPNQAWDFIRFLTNQTNSAAYAHAAGRPPARLALANDPTIEPALRPFVAQAPFGVTWYRNQLNKTDMVCKQAIDAVLAGQPVTEVLNKLTKQATHILRNEPYD